MSSAVSIANGGFRYGAADPWIFRNATLSVDFGEVVQFVGRNGCGKTTLLKVVAGVLSLEEGRRSVADGATAVYMDQSAGDMLAKGLTIDDHLRAVGRANSSVCAARLMLEEFSLDLHERLDEFVGHLSGGGRQIIALLTAITSEAKILCLDEFTSALDQRSVLTANLLLQRYRDTSNAAVVLVSHQGRVADTVRRFEFDNITDHQGSGAQQ